MPSAAAKAYAARLEAQRKSAIEAKAAKVSGASVESLLAAGAQYARKKAGERNKHSKVIIPEREAALPRFDKGELVLGKMLGKGGFGIVYEIKGFKTDNVSSSSDVLETVEVTSYHKRDEDIDAQEDQGKAFIAKHCLRKGGEARYAVKFMREDVCADPPQFIQSTIDFAVETSFLSSIEHPNIIKIRACATCDPFNDSYFIVLDKLQETLESRLVSWGKMQKRTSSFMGKLGNRKGGKSRDLLEKRLVAAFDLSAALGYLHERNIVYRDLKPENIGFDVRDDVKLFDFGLAKEIDPKDKKADDDTYDLSGDTGSLRYMAPEVFLGKPYNFTVDTFSFSILLWEMMSLTKPYIGFTENMHRKRVIMDGWRPPIDDSWSISLRSLMKRGWSNELSVRPPMSSVTAILKKEVSKLRDGDETGLEHLQRRSTYVLRRK